VAPLDGELRTAPFSRARQRTVGPGASQASLTRKQEELAALSDNTALSDNSVHVVALASNHDIPSSHSGQPAVVVRAVQAVVGAARSHSRLVPCRRLFPRLGRSLPHLA
jgi:hypothetical protein